MCIQKYYNVREGQNSTKVSSNNLKLKVHCPKKDVRFVCSAQVAGKGNEEYECSLTQLVSASFVTMHVVQILSLR